jgi:transcriptional regulator with XRE-family HTH domain
MMISKRSCVPLDICIGKNIRRIRLDKNFTQKDVGFALNVSLQQIIKYESGKNRISASRLMNLAIALDVGIMKFFEQNQ